MFELIVAVVKMRYPLCNADWLHFMFAGHCSILVGKNTGI